MQISEGMAKWLHVMKACPINITGPPCILFDRELTPIELYIYIIVFQMLIDFPFLSYIIILEHLLFLQLERLIEKNYYLNQSAREAYRSYLQAYASHAHKSAFDVNKLDLQKVVKAFGFSVPPRVNLSKLFKALPLVLRSRHFFI